MNFGSTKVAVQNFKSVMKVIMAVEVDILQTLRIMEIQKSYLVAVQVMPTIPAILTIEDISLECIYKLNILALSAAKVHLGDIPLSIFG
jgi:hypothetical protein